MKQLDLESEKRAANEVLTQLWQVLKTHDLDMLSRIMAHDPDMIIFGTDAAERFVGYEAFKMAFKRMAVAFDVEQLDVHDELLTIHRSGEVVWFSAVADATAVTSGGQHVTIEGVRITGVLERREGRWMVVQYHSSMPIAGQSVKY